MTPNEVSNAQGLIQSLWPRSKWSPQEWEVFQEKAVRLPIDGEQAAAAIRELKATSDKYPSVALLLAAMRGACQETPRGVSPVTAVPYPSVSAYRAQLKCHGLTMPDDSSPADIVLAWWKQTIVFRMAMHGDIPPERQGDFAEDCRTLGRMTEMEIAEQWDSLMLYAMELPVCQQRRDIRQRIAAKVRKAVRS